MKRIEAIIRKTRFEDVKEALLNSDINWFEYHAVHGIGQSRQERIYRGDQMAHAAERSPIHPPKNKEEYYYRSIFSELFPSNSAALSVPSEASVACSTAAVLEWEGVHVQAY